MNFRYFRPLSLTWLAGAGAVLTGIAAMFLPDNYQLQELSRLIAMFTGGTDSSPAVLIFFGLSAIGLRDAQERHYESLKQKSEVKDNAGT